MMRDRKDRSSMTRPGVLGVVALGLILGLAGLALYQFSGIHSGGVDFQREGARAEGQEFLGSLEETSLSVESRFHEISLALRHRDRARFRGWLGDSVESGAFPPENFFGDAETAYGEDAQWSAGTETRDIPAGALLASIYRLLDPFDELVDLRIKMLEAQALEKGEGRQGRLELSVVGRVHSTKRAWLRLEAGYRMGQQEDGWILERFVPEKLSWSIVPRAAFVERARLCGIMRTPALSPVGNRDHNISYGAATGDLDQNGILDIVALNRDRIFVYLGTSSGAYNERASEMQINLPKDTLQPTAVLITDYDNDGDSDLFFSGYGVPQLLEQRKSDKGLPVYVNVSRLLRLRGKLLGMSAVSADLNGDRRPDFYIAAYGDESSDPPNRYDYASNGTPNVLLLSQDDGSYQDVAPQWGVDHGGWSLAAGFADVDSDGDADLYVANDFGGGDVLYMNEGQSFRTDEGIQRVLGRGFGMGVSFGDYDNDGDLDLHVTNMSSKAGRRILGIVENKAFPALSDLPALKRMTQGNLLYENLGQGQFRDISAQAGPFPGGWAWGGGFLDFDNDGYQDLHTPNGFLSGRAYDDT